MSVRAGSELLKSIVFTRHVNATIHTACFSIVQVSNGLLQRICGVDEISRVLAASTALRRSDESQLTKQQNCTNMSLNSFRTQSFTHGNNRFDSGVMGRPTIAIGMYSLVLAHEGDRTS
ncbi:hypothetical protein AcW1_010152 [Taiwanofungus camphoratus]|nr:hypothetical protein AcV5_003048 [Antrodia cinnamomea]KAI0946793.1 hypothetical protein AcW1_010152 [Antrodia cinnamomea]